MRFIMSGNYYCNHMRPSYMVNVILVIVDTLFYWSESEQCTERMDIAHSSH